MTGERVEPAEDERITITSAVGLKAEHLKALGRITVNYSFMEMMLRSSLALLCEPDDEIARALTSGAGFGQLLAHVASVCEIRAVQGLRVAADFAELKGRMEKAAKKRNDVVHALWEVGDTPGVITAHRIQRRSRKGSLEKGTPLTSMDLNAISDEILDVASALAAFYGGVSLAKESFNPHTR